MDDGDSSRPKLFDPTADALSEIKSGARAGQDAVRGQQGAAAADGLRRAENGALDSAKGHDGDDSESALEAARASENGVEAPSGGYYSGSGKSKQGKGKAKGRFRKKGPIALLMAVLLGAGGLMMGGQALMPFSIVAQFQEAFDTIKVSNEARTRTMWAKQMSNQGLSNPIHQRYFGFGGATFKVSDRQKTKLEAQGIFVKDVNTGSGPKTVMLFDDGSGKLKVVTASDADVPSLRGADLSQVDLSDVKLGGNIDVTDIEIDTSDVKSFYSAFSDVPDFRNGYIAGSRTWRGSIGAWFDSMTVAFLKSNKLSRNRFIDFQEKVKAQNEGNTRSAQRKAAIETLETDEQELSTKSQGYEEKEGEDIVGEDGETHRGEPTLDRNETNVSVSTKSAQRQEIRNKIKSITETRLGKGVEGASTVANMACSVLDVIGAVNILIVAQETIQILSLTTGYLEAFDKVKAGEGTDSPVHVLAETLTTPKATTSFKNVGSDDENGDTVEEVVPGKEYTTAMQSSGMAALYGNTKVNAQDASVANFNVGAHLKTLLGSIGASAASFAACGIARFAVAAAGIAESIAAIAVCAASFGLGCLVEGVVDELGSKILGSIAVASVLSAVLGVVTPLAVKWFTTDLISDLAGEDLGNALVSGANLYMGSNHKNGGGSLASAGEYTQFALQQQESIAETARFERETLSPFDVTSQYTFAGSLVKQLATLSTIKSPIFGTLGTITRMASNSIVSLLPSASAYDVAQKLPDPEEYSDTCPWLASIGAVGDAYCNPYIITDVSTINDDPLQVVNDVADYGGIDGEGDIEDGSNLAKYIKFCSQRSSPFGLADNNIASAFAAGDIQSGSNTLDTVANSALGAVPIIGDFLDMLNNGNQLRFMGWISGESCVAKSESVAGDASSWSENMTYQRFIEDQRYLESVNPDYKSPVTAYLEKEELENPTDTSYEGILARNSGLTKETVVALLDVIQEENYIANYDPSDAYVFGEDETQIDEHAIQFETSPEMPGIALATMLGHTLYADLRSRNFAV